MAKKTAQDIANKVSNMIWKNQQNSGWNPTGFSSLGDATNVGRFVSHTIHLKRFYLGNEYDSAAGDSVFGSGYEDPTHLTFKVEFGEWGASVNDMEMIRTLQSQNLYDNIYYMDYDQMPMGLMDLNFDFVGDGFSTTTSYNAYNYLMNRNEDRRAQYIRDFVEGIYSLEYNFPYVFSKIQGLDKLQEMSETRGRRLKDATITLTCLPEGIDQKVRTLFEMYRKSAYDEVWQRWILPDVYRYFRMIIYVFDDRDLQGPYGEFNADMDKFPIYAFECSPCEFVIKGATDNDYSQDYTQGKNHETTIEIKVHDVKTYFSNKLFNRVKHINDFTSVGEHGLKEDYVSARENTINWRYVWLQRMFMLPDEYHAFAPKEKYGGLGYTHEHGDDSDVAALAMETAKNYEYMLPQDTWHEATFSDHAYIIRKFSDFTDMLKKIITTRTRLIRDSRTSDRYYFTNNLVRLEPNDLQYLINNNMSHMTLFDMDKIRKDLEHRISVMRNNMKRIVIKGEKVNSSLNDPGLDTSTSLPTMTMTELNDFIDTPRTIVDPSIYGGENVSVDFVSIPEQPDYEKDIVDVSVNGADNASVPFVSIPPEQKYKHKLADVSVFGGESAPMTMNGLLDSSVNVPLKPISLISGSLPVQVLVEIVQNLEKIDLPMISQDMNLTKIQHDLVTIIENLDKPDMELVQMDMNLEKTAMVFTEMMMNLDKVLHRLVQMEMNLDKDNQPMVQMDMNLEKPIQEFVQIIQNLDVMAQEFVHMNTDVDYTPSDDYVHMLDNQYIPSEIKPIDIIDGKPLDAIPFVSPNVQTDGGIRNKIETMEIVGSEGVRDNGEMISMEINDSPIEHTPMVSVNDMNAGGGLNSNPMGMVGLQVDIVDDDVKNDIIPIEIGGGVPEHAPMVEPIMNMGVSHHDMVEMEMNVEHPENQPMVVMEQNVPKNIGLNNDGVDFVGLIENDGHVIHEDMVSPIMDTEEFNHSPMVSLIQTDSPKTNHVMPHLKETKLDNEVIMPQIVENVEKTETPKMPNLNEEKGGFVDMKMPELVETPKKDDNKVMPTISEGAEIEHQDMDIELVGQKPNGTSVMPEVKEDEIQKGEPIFPHMNMDVHVSTDAVMSHLTEATANKQEAVFVRVHNDDVSIVENTAMAHIDINTSKEHAPFVHLTDSKQSETLIPFISMKEDERKGFGDEVHLDEMIGQEQQEHAPFVRREDEDVEIPELQMVELNQDNSEHHTPLTKDEQKIQSVFAENPELKKKLEIFTQLDLSSLEKTSVSNLVAMADLMEKTMIDLKEKVSGRKQMTTLKKEEPKSKLGTLLGGAPIIQTAERDLFSRTPMRPVDDSAMARANIAYDRANPKKKKSDEKGAEEGNNAPVSRRRR